MREPISRKKFIFNENIDQDFLFSMYEDDLQYVEEIFKTTLDQLNTVVNDVPVAYDGKKVTDLKKIVHKIKPAFGFTGFLKTERACQEFEDACSEGIAVERLEKLYQPFWTLLVHSMEIMNNQHDQLKEFNNQ